MPHPDWVSLPPEIWLKILGYLPQYDLFYNISQTSSMLRVYSLDKTLWRYLDLNEISKVVFDNEEEESLDDCCQVENIINGLTNQFNMQEKIFAIKFSRYSRNSSCGSYELNMLKQFVNLQELDVGFCSDIDTKSIETITTELRSLSVLNVEGCKNLNDESMVFIATLRSLAKLNISYCPLLTDESLFHMQKLSVLFYSFNSDGNMRFSDHGVVSLMQSHQQLEELILDGENLSDIVCRFAANNLPKLRIFELSFAQNITNRGLTEICKMSLKQIKLRKLCDIKSDILYLLFSPDNLTMRNLQQITITDLETLDDRIMLAISSNCHDLQYFCIDWCWEVTDTGVEAVTSSCKKLQSISFVGLFKLTGSWLKMIDKYLPYLRFLDLSDCNNINDKELVAVAGRVPSAEIYTYYHELILPNVHPSHYVDHWYEEDDTKVIKCSGEVGIKVDF